MMNADIYDAGVVTGRCVLACSRAQLSASSASSSQPSKPARKCGRTAYSLAAVADGAVLCRLSTFVFRSGGLWSSVPYASRSGGRAGLPKLIRAGEPSESKKALFVPGMELVSAALARMASGALP
jgi:hypothetical protein